MRDYPYYPAPVKNKISQYINFFKKSNSWLDGLYERSYTMKMGHVKLPKLDLYIPNEPELIRRVMIEEVGEFPKHPLLQEVLEPLLGESIFSSNGDVWRGQREYLNPSFEMTRISHVLPLMQEATLAMMQRLEAIADDGGYCNIDEEMTFVTADIIFRTILSTPLSPTEGREIIHAFQSFQQSCAKVGMQKLFGVAKLFGSLGGNQLYRRSGRRIRAILREIIEPRYYANEEEHHDILSSLLRQKDANGVRVFELEALLDQVAMLFLAGHETSASSLSWTLYLLGYAPDIQERVYEELQADSTKEGAKGSYRLLESVIKESLRLYPPVGFFVRVASQESIFRGKTLAKGSAIAIAPWLMHRNERYWEDPHQFNPYRFYDHEAITPYSYFPFGLGQRTCIGERFAMQESLLILSSILKRYRVELKEGFVPEIAGRLTIRSLNGISVRLIKREK
jgi:cytochrome P450